MGQNRLASKVENLKIEIFESLTILLAPEAFGRGSLGETCIPFRKWRRLTVESNRRHRHQIHSVSILLRDFLRHVACILHIAAQKRPLGA
jgi:hypothetical protein